MNLACALSSGYTTAARARYLYPEVQLYMSVVILMSGGGVTGCPLLAYRIVLVKLMTCEILFGTICDARSIDKAKISMRYVTRHRMKVRHGPLLQLLFGCSSATTAADGIQRFYSVHSVDRSVHDIWGCWCVHMAKLFLRSTGSLPHKRKSCPNDTAVRCID